MISQSYLFIQTHVNK